MRTRGITKANVRYAVLAVLAIAALALGISYFRKDAPESHRHARLAILYYTFSRLDAPIVILGDSITEASTLPRSLCDHPIVNAGFNGASTTSDLGTWLLEALDGALAERVVLGSAAAAA